MKRKILGTVLIFLVLGVGFNGTIIKFVSGVKADQEIIFPDKNLEEVILKVIGKSNGPIYESDLEKIIELDATQRGIKNIKGLEYCKNLKELWLGGNNISDISPLSNLTDLRWVGLWGNNISDISPLSNLTDLTQLHIQNNNISDISALSNLTNLELLELYNNNISDISALSNLTNLLKLWLGHNNISNISPLSYLTNLKELSLWNNKISDISPLIENSGINKGDIVDISYNPLNLISIETYVPELESRGIELTWKPVIDVAKLSITSNPSASVYINDKQRGTTPLEVELAPGNYTIEIKKQDYKTYTETIELSSGEKKSISAKLSPVFQPNLTIVDSERIKVHENPIGKYTEYLEVSIYYEKLSDERVDVFVEINSIMHNWENDPQSVKSIELGEGFMNGALTLYADENTEILRRDSKLLTAGDRIGNSIYSISYVGIPREKIEAKAETTILPSGEEITIYKGGEIAPAFYKLYSGEIPYWDFIPVDESILDFLYAMPYIGDMASILRMSHEALGAKEIGHLLDDPIDLPIYNFDQVTKEWSKEWGTTPNAIVMKVPLKIDKNLQHKIYIEGEILPKNRGGFESVTFSKSFSINENKKYMPPKTAGSPYIGNLWDTQNIMLHDIYSEDSVQFAVFSRTPPEDPDTKYIYVEVFSEDEKKEEKECYRVKNSISDGIVSIRVPETAQIDTQSIETRYYSCDPNQCFAIEGINGYSYFPKQNPPFFTFEKAEYKTFEEPNKLAILLVNYLLSKIPKIGKVYSLLLTLSKYYEEKLPELDPVIANDAIYDTISSSWSSNFNVADTVSVFPIKFAPDESKKIGILCEMRVDGKVISYNKIIDFNKNKVISAKITCPANLHLYDEKGNHVGINQVDGIDLGIPNVLYNRTNEESEEIIVFEKYDKLYLDVIGKENGYFDLYIEKYLNEETKKITYNKIQVQSGSKATLEVTSSSDYKMNFDYDGDGKYEKTIKPDKIERIGRIRFAINTIFIFTFIIGIFIAVMGIIFYLEKKKKKL